VGLGLRVQLEDGVLEGEGAFKVGDAVTLGVAEAVTEREEDTDGEVLPLSLTLPLLETSADDDVVALADGVSLRLRLADVLSLTDAVSDGDEDIEDAGVVEPDAATEPETLAEEEGDRVALTDTDGVTVTLEVPLTVADGVMEAVLDGDAPTLNDAEGDGVALSLIAVALVDPAGHSKPSAHGPVHPPSPMAEVFPKRPGGHAVHADALLVLYVPAGHDAEVMAALEVMLPGQM
jgi:hypothetical protein